MNNEPKIYVADLAAYNHGILHGAWIDPCEDVEDIHFHIQNMFKNSPVEGAEEYAIHDYDGFEYFRLGEYDDLAYIHQVACFINEHSDIASALLNHFCGCVDEAKKALEESYCGVYRSLAEYAQGLTEETSDVPEHLAFYIDYEAMARDMELSGDIFSIQGTYDEVHVFWSV